MPFPLSIKGVVAIHIAEGMAGTTESVGRRVEKILREAKVESIVRTGSCVSFKSGIVGRGNWDLMLPIDAGSIEIIIGQSEMSLRYKLSTYKLIMILTVLMIVMIGIYVYGRGDYSAFKQTKFWILICLGWLWICGVNYGLAALRFPGWLKRGVSPGV